ncbi:pentapeptide repeat-containing protein [Actinoplanes sp. NBRC 103695]|uniref:pentapeptide repeat-containing protein n=1 Tax=Actinoplanes sp. NBRC 103695 TaxID=3032202 RepID=UPI002553D45C|nr:pentapeptide repeat-containing protein [Actinoplanes sp. NBRC 103695]
MGVGLYLTNNFNWDQFRLEQERARQQQSLALQQQDLALKGQRAERFTKAIDQLGREGNSQLGIRLGGIYALETLMRDVPNDENTIIEVLCAFVRTHAPLPKIIPKDVPRSPIDVRAALAVLSRRPDPGGHTYLDFSNTLLGLDGMDLRDANLTGANFNDADLTGANLSNAYLRDTQLSGADLTGADLSGADLLGAYLAFGNLRGANLVGADLFHANLTDASLRATNLGRANLYGADLRGADLTGADLYAADLTTVDLGSANLANVDLRCTEMDSLAKLPPGVAHPLPAALESPMCQE